MPAHSLVQRPLRCTVEDYWLEDRVQRGTTSQQPRLQNAQPVRQGMSATAQCASGGDTMFLLSGRFSRAAAGIVEGAMIFSNLAAKSGWNLVCCGSRGCNFLRRQLNHNRFGGLTSAHATVLRIPVENFSVVVTTLVARVDVGHRVATLNLTIA